MTFKADNFYLVIVSLVFLCFFLLGILQSKNGNELRLGLVNNVRGKANKGGQLMNNFRSSVEVLLHPIVLATWQERRISIFRTLFALKLPDLVLVGDLMKGYKGASFGFTLS